MKKLQKDNKGFTIIEVLIVLAIAGLILLIVFLAVPALQRNSRNTQAKNEAASILGAVNERVNNNNGTLPTDTDGAEIASAANTKNFTTVKVVAVDGLSGDAASDVSDEQALVVTKAKCKASVATRGEGGAPQTPADLVEAGTGRQVVIVYQIEDSKGTLPACTES